MAPEPVEGRGGDFDKLSPQSTSSARSLALSPQSRLSPQEDQLAYMLRSAANRSVISITC